MGKAHSGSVRQRFFTLIYVFKYRVIFFQINFSLSKILHSSTEIRIKFLSGANKILIKGYNAVNEYNDVFNTRK